RTLPRSPWREAWWIRHSSRSRPWGWPPSAMRAPRRRSRRTRPRCRAPAAPRRGDRPAAASLFVEELQHRREELRVRGDDVAARHVALLAREIAHEAAPLANEERARRHVPRREPGLPAAVDPDGRR